MKSSLTILILLNIFIGIACSPVYGQVMQEWASVYNGNGNLEDHSYSIAADNSGNVYVTGYSDGGSTSNDYLTIKYNPAGDAVWVKRYNNPSENGSDQARSIAVNDSGNVYVTGSSTGNGTYGDFFTIKYNSSGDTVWTKRWDSDFHQGDGARDIALDFLGNVFVTGAAYRGGNAWDCVTIKYSSSGVEQWVGLYTGELGDFDEGYAVTVDNSGNAYVTGRCGTNGSGDFLTIKYNPAGDSLWVKKYDGPDNGLDEAYDIAVDNSGNAYVTGRSLANNTGYDCLTIKYSPTGDSLWTKRFNGTANDIDEAYALALDNSGNVCITGVSNHVGGSLDYVTIKYSGDGLEQLVQYYNGPGSSYDYAYSIAVDEEDNIYVTGESPGGSPTYTDVATIKYNSAGIEQWVQRYNGSGNSGDIGRAIVVNNSGNVFVTGDCVGTGTSFDYVTIKYSQSVTNVFDSGSDVPESFSLEQNYPNPFNPSTTISFSIPKEEFVSLKVFNSLGEEVADLLHETKPAGNYSVSFSASQLSSGVYFYKIFAGSFVETKKMIYLR
jgi:uncharacterized delta-60 repeat protein